MTKVYAGLRVVDFTTTIAGPQCTRLLADLGADVIKIEGPEGDLMRTRPPLRNNVSAYFSQLNAGKKCITLDLKDKRAVAAARGLAEGADVLVENYRPGVMKRLGLDYISLADTAPRLVYCSISGYGQTGPSAELAAYAPVIHAASGYDLAHMAHQAGRKTPDNCGIYVADVLSGTYAFGAVASALVQRAATGKGQNIDVSMFESMLSLTLGEVMAAQFEVPPFPSRSIFGPVAAKDGFINMAIASERTFQSMCAVAGRMDWIEDARFKKYMDRRGNWAALMDEFEMWSKQMTVQELLAALERHSVPAAAYRTVREAMADPQLIHRQAFSEVHDAAGSLKVLNPPFRMTGSDTSAGPRAAALGENTREVLLAAGFGPSEIDVLAGR